MSFNVPRFPCMPNHRSVMEQWTYRWDQQSRRYVRAAYRPLSVTEPFDNPREESERDPPVNGLPGIETILTQTPLRFSGANVGIHGYVVPVVSTVSSPMATPP